MPFIIFDKPFSFTPEADRRISVNYAAGKSYNVTRECATKATAQGVRYRLAPKDGDEDHGDISTNEGHGPTEGESGENAEIGPAPDDGSSEAERDSFEGRGYS